MVTVVYVNFDGEASMETISVEELRERLKSDYYGCDKLRTDTDMTQAGLWAFNASPLEKPPAKNAR